MSPSKTLPSFIPTCAIAQPARNLAATTALSALLFSTPLCAPAATLPPPPSQLAEHALADEVWSIINKYYADSTFNSTDWGRQRDILADANLPNRSATYAAMKKSISNLHDRYTRMLTPSEMESLRKFDVSGVGLLLTNSPDGALVVATQPASDTAAGRAGVRRGEQLSSVDGVSIEGRGGFEVAEMMQGADGEEMTLEFVGRDQPVRLIRRVQGETSPVSNVQLKRDEQGVMGYVRLREFSAAGRDAVRDALKQVISDGADWIVVDLRGNGGGIFEGALEIAGLFEGDGVPVARVSSRAEGEEVFRSRVVGGGGSVVPKDMPVVLLVDSLSASSSEVLASGLRDSCRAIIAGEHTFGKGLIQGVMGLSDGGGVVVTVGQYRTPGGDVIQDVGIEPQIKLKVTGVRKILRGFGIEKLSDVELDVKQVRSSLATCEAKLGE